MLLRRGQLYAGLLMLPWVLLYGVTAFLFNHPTAFSDQSTVAFDRDSLRGTALEIVPSPRETAERVLAVLRERNPGAKYELTEPADARFNREFAFATVRTEREEISLLFEATGAGGTIRARPMPAAKPAEVRAPFAIGADASPAKATTDKPAGKTDGLFFADSLVDRVRRSVPDMLHKHGYPTGEVTVTSVPDVVFTMRVDDVDWKVSYNAVTGAVSGKASEPEPAAEPLSTRRFLTRLHLAHGYPFRGTIKWVWAVLVDATAVVMLFWCLSGLFMWWQIKATRRWGFLVLLVSLVAATIVGFGMHEFLSMPGK